MTEFEQEPDEPGWNHKPGDPTDTERWWTGADWSEYTRPSPQLVDGGDDLTSTVDRPSAGSVDSSTASTDVGATAGSVWGADFDVGATAGSVWGSGSGTQYYGAAGSAGSSGRPAPPTADSVAPETAVAGSTPPGPTGFGTAAAGAAQPGSATSGSAGGAASVFSGLGASSAVRSLERIFEGADAVESGWDRNLATLPWIPGLGGISVVAYVLSGSQMSRHARSHISGAINFGLSSLIMIVFMVTISLAGNANVAFGVLWWLVLGVAFAGVVYLLSKRDADRLGPIPYWVWFGLWALAGIITATFSTGLFAFPILFGAPVSIVVLVNAVRGRVGMESNFLGYPVLPILSQR